MSPEGMSPAPEDRDYDASDSRRSFLKKLGIFGVGVAAAGSGIYAAKKYGEEEKEDLLEKLTENYQEQTATDGDTLWGYYKESGWADQGISELAYYDATEQLNPEAEEIKKRLVLDGHSYKLPWLNNSSE